MKKLILIDGNAILHKGYHALPPFKTGSGELVNAVYGFSSMLLNLLNQQKPDYIACAFDVKEKTFRHEKYVEYKAGRAAAPDDLYPQLGRVKEILAAFQVPVFERAGYEADDILGCLAREGERLGLSVYIVTGDLDTLQLVSDNVRVLAMHRGFSRPVIFDREAVFERYGLWPEQIVDMKALQGDSSDNIKGVNGIGKKTAADLLVKYGSLEGIYENLGEIGGAVGRKLAEGKDDAYLSQELARIVCDIPDLGFDLHKCVVHDYDAERLLELFRELEFKSLVAKLLQFNGHAEKKKAGERQMNLF